MKAPTKGQLVKAIRDIVDAEDARVKAWIAGEDTSQYRAHLDTMISVASNMIGPYVEPRGRRA